jgi:hypothetical protein
MLTPISLTCCTWSFKLLVRNQRFYVDTVFSVESQRTQHRPVIEPIQVQVLRVFRKVLVGLPRRNAKRVALLPIEFLAVDDSVACPGNDMIDA